MLTYNIQNGDLLWFIGHPPPSEMFTGLEWDIRMYHFPYKAEEEEAVLIPCLLADDVAIYVYGYYMMQTAKPMEIEIDVSKNGGFVIFETLRDVGLPMKALNDAKYPMDIVENEYASSVFDGPVD